MSDYSISNEEHKNALSGAVFLAIEKAEQFKTKLTVKMNGKVENITPEELRKRLAKESR